MARWKSGTADGGSGGGPKVGLREPSTLPLMIMRPSPKRNPQKVPLPSAQAAQVARSQRVRERLGWWLWLVWQALGGR